MTDTNQTAADQATAAAVDAHLDHAPPEQAQVAFDRASIAHRRSAPPEQEGTPGHGGWRDGSDPAALSPMPAAPAIATSDVDNARATLNERSEGHSDLVARISPRDGHVIGWIDLGGILPADQKINDEAVLNGIAYDAQHDRLFVTGKQWPKIFEIKIRNAR